MIMQKYFGLPVLNIVASNQNGDDLFYNSNYWISIRVQNNNDDDWEIISEG